MLPSFPWLFPFPRAGELLLYLENDGNHYTRQLGGCIGRIDRFVDTPRSITAAKLCLHKQHLCSGKDATAPFIP
jgi:hypothetical protein